MVGRKKRECRAGGGNENKDKNRGTHASASYDNDENDGAITLILQYGLLDQLVWGVIMVTLQYKSKIGPKGRGGTPP